MKKDKILKVAIICLIPLILITLNLRFLLFDENFYRSEFTKLNIYSKFDNADKINNDLLDYFKNSDRSPPEIDIYNNDERQHLLDVKLVLRGIFRFSNLMILCLIAIFAFLLSKSKNRTSKKELIQSLLLNGGITTLILLLIITVTSSVSFNTVFASMHTLFFKNGTWLFPERSNLINMYPITFFQDFAIRLAVNIVITSGLLVVFSYIYMKPKRIKSSKKIRYHIN